MQSLLKIACTAAALLACCGDPKQPIDDRSAHSLQGICLVDEVYRLSQGLDTDGSELTVRGWLGPDNIKTVYNLYNASWDPFDPQTKNGVTYLILKFESPPSDFWVGQYVNVAGRVSTEGNATRNRTVTLINAKVVSSSKVEDGETIPYRIKEAEQDGTGQPATRPESKSEGGDKPQPEAEGRSR